MVSRFTRPKANRGRRRSADRAPAVWLGDLSAAVERSTERPAHGSRGGFHPGWRFASGIIVILMLGMLGIFIASNVFYVHTIAVGGIETISKEEVFALTGVANYHIFWIDPVQVRENLIQSPTISDAEVRVGWPPQMLQIVIQEREPALIWEQSGVATWLDLQGQVMKLREDRADLVRVQVEAADIPLGPNDQVDPEVINGALQLTRLLPEVRTLRYNPDKGLGYRDERGWDAWLGTGTDMPNRILIYNALTENLLRRGIQPGEVNVADPEAVYYTTLFAVGN